MMDKCSQLLPSGGLTTDSTPKSVLQLQSVGSAKAVSWPWIILGGLPFLSQQ